MTAWKWPIAVAIVASGLSATAGEKFEPRYEGKPLPHWIQKLETASNEEERDRALTAIGSFKADAAPAIPILVRIPALKTALGSKSEQTRTLAEAAIAAIRNTEGE